jgi:hypothetical protein
VVGCNISFTEFGNRHACVALESPSTVFVISGIGCVGGIMTSGTISCASTPGEINEETCILRDRDLNVAEARCDCPDTNPGGCGDAD